MNAATTVHTKEEAARAGVLLLEIPLDKISESKKNPRTQFDEKKLAELADDIKQHGVLEPVLVRPLTNGKAGTYELVFGARRYRASKLAKRETIPATVRELTDAECLELQLVENVQRADTHELDEGQGYADLLSLQPSNTVETIAAKVAKSPAYVNGRLQLLKLIDEAKQAFRAGKLNYSHAFEIARLQPKDQQRAMQECFPQHRNAAAILKDQKAEAVTVRQLRAWIEREVLLDLTNAPFDANDETLLPSAGTCATCPKRTGSNPLLFADVQRKSTCTDRACYQLKLNAFVQIRVKRVDAEGEKVLSVSQAPSWQTKGQSPSTLHEGEFRRAREKGECPTTKPAILVDGRNAGTIFHICQNDKCPVHMGASRYQRTPQERVQRARELLAERVEKQTRVRILDAIRKKLPETLPRTDLEMVALDYFRRLGHDNHRRVSKLYAWQEKKSKTSWGGQAVDYDKIAAAAVLAMKTPDVHRFLGVCALVSDLYCPGYNPKQSLAKESNLARTANRYKIDVGRVAAAVRADLTKNKKTKGRETKNKTSPKSRPGRCKPSKADATK
jgi:ParB family transcriptional regulator, chromosome partitioning protein